MLVISVVFVCLFTAVYVYYLFTLFYYFDFDLRVVLNWPVWITKVSYALNATKLRKILPK